MKPFFGGGASGRNGKTDGGGVRRLFAFSGLLALWLLMSGLFSPLLISFGVFSSAVALAIARRMDRVDGESLVQGLAPLSLAGYLAWLMVEIARANWAVCKVILSPGMPIRQRLFPVAFSQKTDLGQVVFANSITLTPGTITVETERDHFLVHALAYAPQDDAALADMDRRVSRIEVAGAR